jgi:hypothetical protein
MTFLRDRLGLGDRLVILSIAKNLVSAISTSYKILRYAQNDKMIKVKEGGKIATLFYFMVRFIKLP